MEVVTRLCHTKDWKVQIRSYFSVCIAFVVLRANFCEHLAHFVIARANMAVNERIGRAKKGRT